MSVPYELTVHFLERPDGGVPGGDAIVTVWETCVCYELRVRAVRKRVGAEGFVYAGKGKVFAERQEWLAGKTYSYQFTFNSDEQRGPAWGVTTQVQRIGELDRDPEQVWRAPQQTGATAPLSQAAGIMGGVDATFTKAEHVLMPPHAPRRAPEHVVAMEFDRAQKAYCYGEEITGAIRFAPAWDLVDQRMGLDYQWRTQRPEEKQRGAHRPVAVALTSSWRAGRAYKLPFRFTIPTAPTLPDAEKGQLDWYVWPVLIPLDGSSPQPLRKAAAKLRLQPGASGASRVMLALKYHLHGLGHSLTGLAFALLAIWVIFFQLSAIIERLAPGAIASLLDNNDILILMAIVLFIVAPLSFAHLGRSLYRRVLRLACPLCGSEVAMVIGDRQTLRALSYECSECWHRYETGLLVLPFSRGDGGGGGGGGGYDDYGDYDSSDSDDWDFFDFDFD